MASGNTHLPHTNRGCHQLPLGSQRRTSHLGFLSEACGAGGERHRRWTGLDMKEGANSLEAKVVNIKTLLLTFDISQLS